MLVAGAFTGLVTVSAPLRGPTVIRQRSGQGLRQGLRQCWWPLLTGAGTVLIWQAEAGHSPARDLFQRCRDFSFLRVLELAATGIGHVHYSTCDFHVGQVRVAALGRHRILAMDGGPE